jgi:two-component system sensor histidine kinase HydH
MVVLYPILHAPSAITGIGTPRTGPRTRGLSGMANAADRDTLPSMNTIIYAAVAVLCLALPLRAWLQDRRSRLRGSFALLGVNLAWIYGAFAGYLVSGLLLLDVAYSVGAAFLPASLYGFLCCLLRRPRPTDTRTRLRLGAAGAALAALFVLAQLTLFHGQPHGSPAAVALGLCVFAGLGFDLLMLVEHVRHATQQVARQRLGYLLGLTGTAVLFSAVEILARNLQGAPEQAGLDLFSAPVLLQGLLPPVGVLLTGALIYFMHQVLVLTRLLDLHEIFSRTLTLALCAAVLVGVEGLAIIWSDTATHSPLHSTWLMMVATVLFLAVYDPMRRAVEQRLNARLNRRGQVLARSLLEVEEALPKAIGLATAFEAVLQPLVASGRAPYATIYLWDQELGQFGRAAARGHCDPEPLEAVPPVSFDEQPGAPLPWLVRGAQLRQARKEPPHEQTAGQRARLMKALGIDVLLPLRSGELLLGWLGLAEEPDTDGFSQDELRRLRHAANRLAVVLENVHGFHQLEEQHRLAALGTMAAGLAHEIRNPLAAIKGAAQYLEPQEGGAGGGDETREFVAIIIDEVDRLEVVVDRFLDYARPLVIEPTAVDVNRLANRSVELLRRQGLPTDIEIELALTEALPEPPGDPALLLQVLENLLRNAVQALARAEQPEAERRVRLHTRLGHAFGHGRGASTVDIVVEDTGPGIPAQERDKLFIPFYTRRAGGTGLGLALCRRIVHAHGGDIEVGDRPGGGARFTVLLPLEPPDGAMTRAG